MSKANTRIKNERKLFADAIDTKNVHVKFTSHKSAIIAYEKKTLPGGPRKRVSMRRVISERVSVSTNKTLSYDCSSDDARALISGFDCAMCTSAPTNP